MARLEPFVFMCKQPVRIAAMLMLLGGLDASRLAAAELRGKVLARDGDQGLAGVVVQLFYGGRPAASGYTNVNGRFLLRIADDTDLRGASLLVTRKPVVVKTVKISGGRDASITEPTTVLAMQGNLSFKTDNVLRANTGSPGTVPKHESSH